MVLNNCIALVVGAGIYVGLFMFAAIRAKNQQINQKHQQQHRELIHEQRDYLEEGDTIYNNWRCNKSQSSKENCPICMDVIPNRKSENIKVLRCGHKLHHTCYHQMIMKGLRNCPICRYYI